jgi:hypothetical protein
LVSIDYFEYPYIYKLKVIHNINGFDLPDISLCTDNKVLFHRSKLYQVFDPGHDLGEFVKNNSVDAVITEDDLDNCQDNEDICNVMIEPNDYRLEPFFDSIQYNITKDLSFNQKKNLMIRANQLFNCSAKVHFRYQSSDSNEEKIENCSQSFQVLESIYGNKDFGICFKLSFNSKGVYLKDDDYIEFVLSFGDKPEFIKSLYLIFSTSFFSYYDRTYDLFLLVHQKTNALNRDKFNSIRISRQGLDGELKMTKTSVNLLSKPHMQQCRDRGKFF